MPDLDHDQEETLYGRLDELGMETVKLVSASDGFPMTWRRYVHEWIARGGKRPPEEPKEDEPKEDA